MNDSNSCHNEGLVASVESLGKCQVHMNVVLCLYDVISYKTTKCDESKQRILNRIMDDVCACVCVCVCVVCICMSVSYNVVVLLQPQIITNKLIILHC